MSFLVPKVSEPKLPPLPPSPVGKAPGVESAELDLKRRLQGAGSRAKSIIAPLGFKNTLSNIKTPTLSDTLGGTFR